MREFSSEMYSYGRYYTYDRAREWFGCANDSPWELPSTESARDLESLSGYFLIRKWVYRSIRVLKRQMEWHPDEAIRIVPWQEDGRYGKDGLHMELRLPERYVMINLPSSSTSINRVSVCMKRMRESGFMAGNRTGTNFSVICS